MLLTIYIIFPSQWIKSIPNKIVPIKKSRQDGPPSTF